MAQALDRSVAVPGARLEVADYRPELPGGCVVSRAEPPAPLTGSGRVALRLAGTLPGGAPCSGWAWARVRLLAPVLVARSALRAGDPLAGVVAPEEREMSAARSPLSRIPAGAVAARPVSPGQVLDERDLRTGPRPGDPVTVVIRLGSLQVEQPGQSRPCARGRACALVPSGRRVEGSWREGRLFVESP